MLILKDLSYLHPNKDLLFENISLSVNRKSKLALIGNNGSGKSTLLKIISGELQPSQGEVYVSSKPYYIPQIFGQFNHLSISRALKVDQKLLALNEILNGNISDENYRLLNDDWTIGERCRNALSFWGLADMDLTQMIGTLSGGQITRVFLAGISIHHPEFVLLDEPSNHLDGSARHLLYEFITSSNSTMIVVSHDRKLLNLLDTVCELSEKGIKTYGGNYNFYCEQKQIEIAALNEDIQSKEKALRLARQIQKETLERQLKLNSRGKAKQEKAGVAKIMMNTYRNQAERSTAKTRSAHEEKVDGITEELQSLRSSIPGIDKMKIGFDPSTLHQGKILFNASQLNFAYQKEIWKEGLDIKIISGERIVIKGPNGSGKTTLIKLILGRLLGQTGSVFRADIHSIYVDQDYSIINNNLDVYEQARLFNDSALLEHEIKTRLNRFLFTKEFWDKPCGALSGGERMRLMLCCLSIARQSPDLIVLDEPTNNLDIQNIEILTAAVNEYQGTLLVVSHDETFVNKVNIKRIISL